MSKHTPGPWEVMEGKHFYSLQVGKDGEAIAEIWRRGDTPQERANAHLIAAAPELLEALEEYLQLFKDGLAEIQLTVSSPEDMDRWDNSADKIRAAISKAKGEA